MSERTEERRLERERAREIWECRRERSEWWFVRVERWRERWEDFRAEGEGSLVRRRVREVRFSSRWGGRLG